MPRLCGGTAQPANHGSSDTLLYCASGSLWAESSGRAQRVVLAPGPEGGCWVRLCLHVVSGSPTWSLSHSRSGFPHGVLASGQSGHPHEGCGSSLRIPAHPVEPLCSATCFHDPQLTAPPTAQRQGCSPAPHSLSTRVPRSRCRKSTWNWRRHHSRLWKVQPAPRCLRCWGL